MATHLSRIALALFTLLFGSTAIGIELVIDNGASGTTATGTWQLSGADGAYGSSSLWGRQPTRSIATYSWSFVAQVSGLHEVSMWWTAWPTRSPRVPVDIASADGTKRVYADQTQNGSRWNPLGTYRFVAGKKYQIKITAQPSPSSTCADAVRILSVVDPNLPPTARIDAITPNPASAGQSVTLTGNGEDRDGTVVAYRWESDLDGVVGSEQHLVTAALSQGVHTISLLVQDNAGAWSSRDQIKLTVGLAPETRTEDIYFALLYFHARQKRELETVLSSIGARSENTTTWKYENSSSGKTYRIHIIQEMASLIAAMYEKDSHIIVKGHANYGLGGIFVPEGIDEHRILDQIEFLDDDLIFNISSPWIAVKLFRMTSKAPNWWPEFKDGLSAVMPYDFGDMRGPPPYNYYITYKIPGDPIPYKIETSRNTAVERFPDAGVPAWYSSTGDSPSPDNPEHRKYFIVNTTQSYQWSETCRGSQCPQPHYDEKTILFRKNLDIDPARLAYKRMLYDACYVSNYYLDTFQRGIMFYTNENSWTTGSYVYLKTYLTGKSDYEIWKALQDHQPVYNYYDFSKRPAEQP